jgi:elongation factor Ts
VHHGGRIGVLIEVNCETDFVARNEAFQQLVKELAMHVAAADPLAVSADQLPAEVVERERSVALEKVKTEGKPEHLWERIADGVVRKFTQERALLDQAFVINPDISVAQRVQDVAASTGENIVVRRFVRFALGE